MPVETDSGVHASAQVVHFETDVERSERAWTIGVNTYLPTDITVVAASSVSDDFHARFSALSRRYRYVIYSSAFCPAILAKGVTWTYKTLDVAAMEAAAKVFLGYSRFLFFSRDSAVKPILLYGRS